MAGVIALDANVLIAAFNEKDQHHQWAVDLIADTATSDLLISALTYAEILVVPARNGLVNRARSRLDTLGYQVAEVSSDDAVKIAETRAMTNLRMPDAVVLQTALSNSAALATTDAQVAKIAQGLGVTVYCP